MHRTDPLQACQMCDGRRVLVDVVGESVCAWCDGTGLEYGPAPISPSPLGRWQPCTRPPA